MYICVLYVYTYLGSKSHCEVEENKLLEESDEDGDEYLQGSEGERLQSDENDKEDRSSNLRPQKKQSRQRKLVKDKVSTQNT